MGLHGVQGRHMTSCGLLGLSRKLSRQWPGLLHVAVVGVTRKSFRDELMAWPRRTPHLSPPSSCVSSQFTMPCATGVHCPDSTFSVWQPETLLPQGPTWGSSIKVLSERASCTNDNPGSSSFLQTMLNIQVSSSEFLIYLFI